jgi:hypothetical protein
VHDADLVRHPVTPDVEGHHDLFERRIARALANPVDRALDLARTAPDRRDRIGDGETQVVVTIEKPTVSGRLMVVAPAAITCSTTRHRKSKSLRVASSAENCTSSVCCRA